VNNTTKDKTISYEDFEQAVSVAYELGLTDNIVSYLTSNKHSKRLTVHESAIIKRRFNKLRKKLQDMLITNKRLHELLMTEHEKERTEQLCQH